jgi:putative endonuclease
MYYVYVLQSQAKPYLYVGLTNNVKRRVGQHQAGREKTTKPYIPFKLLFTEPFPDRVQARIREKYLKSGIGKEWIKNKYS